MANTYQTLCREVKGSGHAPTFELSPGWNADMSNENH